MAETKRRIVSVVATGIEHTAGDPFHCRAFSFSGQEQLMDWIEADPLLRAPHCATQKLMTNMKYPSLKTLAWLAQYSPVGIYDVNNRTNEGKLRGVVLSDTLNVYTADGMCSPERILQWHRRLAPQDLTSNIQYKQLILPVFKAIKAEGRETAFLDGLNIQNERDLLSKQLFIDGAFLLALYKAVKDKDRKIASKVGAQVFDRAILQNKQGFETKFGIPYEQYQQWLSALPASGNAAKP